MYCSVKFFVPSLTVGLPAPGRSSCPPEPEDEPPPHAATVSAQTSAAMNPHSRWCIGPQPTARRRPSDPRGGAGGRVRGVLELVVQGRQRARLKAERGGDQPV